MAGSVRARPRWVDLYAERIAWITGLSSGTLFFATPFLYELSRTHVPIMTLSDKLVSGAFTAFLGGSVIAGASVLIWFCPIFWWRQFRDTGLLGKISSTLLVLGLLVLAAGFWWTLFNSLFLWPVFGDGKPVKVW